MKSQEPIDPMRTTINKILTQVFSKMPIPNNSYWWILLDRFYTENIKHLYTFEIECEIKACIYVIYDEQQNSTSSGGSLSLGFVSQTINASNGISGNLGLASDLLSRYPEFQDLGAGLDVVNSGNW